jgi:peptide/nickel transport system permease protein
MPEQTLPEPNPVMPAANVDSWASWGSLDADEPISDLGRLSLSQLIWRRFLANRVAVTSGVVLIALYLMALLAPFLAPYDFARRHEEHIYKPPQALRFVTADGKLTLRPFVYGFETTLDMSRFAYVHVVDETQVFPVKFFVRGEPYKLLGVIPANVHLLGVEAPGTLFLLGTDEMGRDLFSRILFGSRISLTIGLVGVALTLVIGASLGTVSGYYGGIVDTLMQRAIEFLMSFPTIPLWAAFAAALPPDWPAAKRYFAITVILSIVGWTGLARQVRAKVLAYREMDFASAAKAVGSSDVRIIFAHMLPNALSHIIVVATLAIPGMILAETALSFLGLGILPPATSWGALLRAAQQVSVMLNNPWLVTPALFVIVAVLAFNLVGDGLRDAVDPYAN